MFKNVKIKRIIKKSISPIFSLLNKCIPKKDNIILLYSPNKGIEHNLLPFREYLIKNRYNEKYNIICCVSSKEYFEKDGLNYVTISKGIRCFFKAKHVFYTTGQIPIKPAKNQIVIHLDHGTTSIKTAYLLSNINNGDDFFFTYYCAPSEVYFDIVQAEFECNKDNIVINSEPVTDVFYIKTKEYDLGKYDKLGLWAPTFRQSDYLGYDDSEVEDLLPTLKPEDYEEFNTLLKNNNIKLIVKLHNMQDLQQYKQNKFSNLIIYSSDDFEKKGYNLYVMLKQTDFILADYSSVYLQYLLLNKPIGFVVPDFDNYRKKRGFVFENAKDYMPGEHINNKKELYDFIVKMAKGQDEYEGKRKKINNIINHYHDGKSCERLIEISKINKK